MKKRKLTLYANIDSEEPTRELATALGIPDPESRQPDLQYFTSVFVSSGYNLNSAFFLPSELISAKDSIVDKPMDIEHEQDKIVGHIFSKAFAYKDRTLFDPKEVADSVGSSIEKVSMDIITATRLYKSRFPEVAEEVASGKYGVSMECYYRDFDVIVDDIIIPKAEASSIGLVDVVNNVVTVVEGKEERGTHRVGRVLRDILFSGCGLVEHPANPDSVILETAAIKNDKFILDLTKIDSYMKLKQKDEAIATNSFSIDSKELSASYGGMHSHDIKLDDGETFLDGSHGHTILSDSVPKGHRLYVDEHDGMHRHSFSDSGKIGKEKGHIHKVYVEKEDGSYRALETSPSVSTHIHDLSSVSTKSEYDMDERVDMPTKRESVGYTTYGGVHYHTVELEDGIKLKTLTPQDLLKLEKSMENKDKKEDAGLGSADGLEQAPTPEICVNFKKYVYEKGGDNPGVPVNDETMPGLVKRVESLPIPPLPGAGETITQGDKIVKERWCSLFDLACHTPGGVATHPNCWRLVLDRTTRDVISTYAEKLQENRKKLGMDKAVSSLVAVIEKAKKLY